MEPNNILSILSALGPSSALSGQMPPDVPLTYQPPTNVLQTVQAPPPVAQPAPQPQVPAASAEPPRQRRSVLDTIGRIADVVARVGGAEALYQPTLDAQQERQFSIEDRGRKISADEIALAANKFALGDAQNTRMGQVARGLQAIQKAGGDVNQAWPILAQRMGIDPETAAAIGQDLATNPNALDGLIAATTDPKYDQAKYGGSIVYGKDAEGNLVAYQPGLGNEGGRNVLPEGITPIDPLQFVNTGGAQVGVGTRSGNPIRILPNTVSPNTAANNRTSITIAGMPARSTADGKDGAGGASDVGVILKDFGINLEGKADPVADLIRGSTNGRIENLAAQAMGMAGRTTPGQANIGRLATIDNAVVLALAGGKLGAGVSNADREFFKEMAGQISNANEPVEKRLAAWAQIKTRLRGITERAKTATPVKPRSNSDGWSIVGVK